MDVKGVRVAIMRCAQRRTVVAGKRRCLFGIHVVVVFKGDSFDGGDDDFGGEGDVFEMGGG